MGHGNVQSGNVGKNLVLSNNEQRNLGLLIPTCEAWPAGWGQFRTFCAFFGLRAILHFVCVPLCSVKSSEGRQEGVHHLLKEFLRLRSLNALISFLACESRGDVELL